MELLQLRYFQKLAKSGHLTQTANELHISPPSLSNTIKRLEKELGVSLFDRSDKKKMRLTEQGEIFNHYISNALSSIKQGIRALKLEENTLQIAMTNFMIWAEAIYYCESRQPDLAIDYSLIALEDINKEENNTWNLF